MSETVRQQLDREFARLYEIRNQLDQSEFLSQIVPAMQKLIGKTYAYRNNCYSCPKSQADYWDVFRKVVGVVVDSGSHVAYVLCEELSIDSRGVPEWTYRSELVFARKDFPERYEKCSLREYSTQKRRVLKQLASPTMMKAAIYGSVTK